MPWEAQIDQFSVEDSPPRVRVRAFGQVFTCLKEPEIQRADPELARKQAWRAVEAALGEYLRAQFDAKMAEK